ncbi:MAG: radical SAM protein [Planctomycetota bacterium]
MVTDHNFRHGFRQRVLHLRIALHVAGRALLEALTFRMAPWRLPGYLRRAYLFLRTLRHSKVAVRNGRMKLHLYFPAYPTPAFWHALGKLRRPDPGPVTVVLSMTRACGYKCPHCYQAKDRGKDLPIDTVVATARAMQDAGVSLFDIEGGEPLLRTDRMIQLAEALDERAEIWMNTTGAKLTPEKADGLMAAGLAGVMVSIHSPDAAVHDAFTGVPGSFDVACDALVEFGRRGAFTVVNCCPTPETVANGGVERIFDLGRTLDCDFVQVIHGKRAGGWLGETDDVYHGETPMQRLKDLHVEMNRRPGSPAVSAQVFEEQADHYGCTAGAVDRFYVGADGEVQPCEFLNLSFGNVAEEGFPAILERMRRHFATPRTDWLCVTQAEAIDGIIREKGLTRTPVPWEHTKELVESWDRGAETPLYRQLGIYGEDER